MENLTRLVSHQGLLTQADATSPRSWVLYALSAALAYPLLVASLRYRRIRASESKQGSLAGMTDNEAFEVINQMAELEFPTIFEKALQFALFRTYGIPTISSLLVKTSQLSSASTAGKRYADTGVLVVEIWANKPSDPRTIEAFARLNYIHAHYIKQGLISNDDLLFTLAQFMCEPINWINAHEWRRTTTLERCASGVFHKSIGDAMQIDYTPLLPYSSSPTSTSTPIFRDGLHFYDALQAWKDAYEAAKMVPDPKNHRTANETTNLLLLSLPAWAKGDGFNAVKAVMDPRLRKAMMYDDPPAIYPTLVGGFLTLRKYVLRYLALPRPTLLRARLVHDTPSPTGHRTLTRYDNFPYYVRPTLLNRYGPSALLSRATGRPLPGDAGYHPEGFVTQTVGPRMFDWTKDKDGGKKREEWEREAERTRERLRAERKGGCPFMVKG